MDNQYNEEPVYYCPHCLSLKIMRVGKTDESYCEDCGNTMIKTTDIFTWQDMYKERYGFNFLENNINS